MKVQIIPNSRTLDIRNLEALPRGTGCRYLEVIRGQREEFVAKQWRRKLIEGTILIDLNK